MHILNLVNIEFYLKKLKDFKSKNSTTHENNLPRKELSALVPQYLSNFYYDTNHSQPTTYYSPKRKVAFTLAEVLITIGIVGCSRNARGEFCSALIIKDGWTIAKDYPW